MVDFIGYDDIGEEEIGEDEVVVGDDLEEIVGAVQEALSNDSKQRVLARNAVALRGATSQKPIEGILPIPAQVAVAPGATVTFRVPTTNPFRPEVLAVDPTTAASFVITSMSVNNQNMLESPNQVPASIFGLPQLKGFRFLTVQPASGMDISITNIGVVAADFRGAFIGTSILKR